MRTVFLLLLGCLWALGAEAADLPAKVPGYVVLEGTQSPNGRYGIMAPAKDADADAARSYSLVELPDCREVCRLESNLPADGWRRSVVVTWGQDSQALLVETHQEDRMGVLQAIILEGAAPRMLDLWPQVAQSIAEAGQPLPPDSPAEIYAHLTDAPKRLQICVFAEGPQPTPRAWFRGEVDLTALRWSEHRAKWLTAKAADLAGKAYAIQSVLMAPEAQGTDEPELLEEVYQGVQQLLPASQASQLQQEQQAWKKAQAKLSKSARAAARQARVRELLKRL